MRRPSRDMRLGERATHFLRPSNFVTQLWILTTVIEAVVNCSGVSATFSGEPAMAGSGKDELARRVLRRGARQRMVQTRG